MSNIAAFSVVTSDGVPANSGTVGQIGTVIGIALAAIATGFSGPVQTAGAVTNLSWTWVAGDVLFLNGTSLSTIAPSAGFVQAIGTAQNSSTVVLDLGIPILL
jgi:hypothetical protein